MRYNPKANTSDTVRLLRPPPKVFTDELGASVWMSGVAPCKLELEDQARLNTDPYNFGLGSADFY